MKTACNKKHISASIYKLQSGISVLITPTPCYLHANSAEHDLFSFPQNIQM